LCTWNVSPIKLGKIVDLLDHVLIGALDFSAKAFSTFLAKWSSINGPFLSDLAISYFFAFLDLTMYLFEAFFLFLVFTPRAFLPHGVIGEGLPIGDLPSPPPCG
jgi:hypothetical protein